MMKSRILGFPRIGAARELKQALERYWQGQLTPAGLRTIGRELKQRHWQIQHAAGLTTVVVGDFSFYDHVLDTIMMLGLIPPRFAGDKDRDELYFQMARGDTTRNLPALEMTKWFDTNYHYLVPEFSALPRERGLVPEVLVDTKLARSAGFDPEPVLLGPITFLCLGKEYGGFDRWRLLPVITEIYSTVIAALAPHCAAIRIDEPILCGDIPNAVGATFIPTFRQLKAAAGSCDLLLASYFGGLGENLDLALQSGCDILHLDLVRGRDQVAAVVERLPERMKLSAGVVDGRNVWRNDYRDSLMLLRELEQKIGRERLQVASSCSLLHVPVDLTGESALDPGIRRWLAFAVQKCRETAFLAETMAGTDNAAELADNAAAGEFRRSDVRTVNPAVRHRCAALDGDMLRRRHPYSERKLQQQWLRLPLLPTTTIGSFPQTPEIRATRRKFRQGTITSAAYEDFLRQEIRKIVKIQEELGLDVLVHGEPERNDMVEYFGEQLDGFAFSAAGWVQSYGSRCVKPPIIYGDISRPRPMTVDWITFAARQTDRPMKGMLTGPVTMLCWSFVRNDLPRATVCRQLALAIRDEVTDLEQAGIRIIQIDEAALREGMPLRYCDREQYLHWAVECFRLATSGVADTTQIHSHMCYSEFNTIIRWIAAMDADVISIEAGRSDMALLQAFRDFDYPNEIGPGIYDIHSPRVPTAEEMVFLLRKALAVVPKERLWVNPDCGLKTRGWPETLLSLRHMVAAALRLRDEL
ncbi:MAG: 5-methyltetrahydropteroyltriglutamate--homocysteine S-methyltransferase [Victivallales bacterium]|nr:5-methyltetrahydropteroyltriglutamate--homocysteine S-methyltransferase [Victivallales bacterium]